MVTSRGQDAGSASELYTLAEDRLYKADATKRAILYHTGANGDDRDYITDTVSGSQVAIDLCNRGYPLYSAQYGSPPPQWGDTLNISRVMTAWTNAQTRLGTKTDKAIGIGVSKGATALLNTEKAHPGTFAALALFVPGVDIQDVWDNDRAGNKASITAAYGGRPPDANNPADNTSSFTSVPIKAWASSSGDPVIVYSLVQSFITAVGGTLVDLGSVGHTAETVDPDEVFDFLAPYL